MRSSLSRFLAFAGLPRVIVLIYLPGYGILAVCLVYLYFDPSYWFYPSVMILAALALIVFGYRLGRRAEERLSEEFRVPYRYGRMAAEVLGPVFCITLIIMLWWMMRDSPPPKYKSLFSFELEKPGATTKKPDESRDLKVLQSRLVDLGEGKYRFVAMIQNRSDHLISLIYVHLTVKNRSGQTIGEFAAPALRSCLPSGQETPVIVRISGAHDFNDYSIRLEKDDAFDPGCLPLEIADHRLQPDNTGFRITGTLKNRSIQIARYPEIIAVLYDEDRGLLDIQTAYPTQPILAPNESSSFLIDLDRATGRPESYRLYSNVLPSAATD